MKFGTPAPTARDFHIVHTTPKNAFSKGIQATEKPGQIYHLIVREKLWRSWSGDSFGIRDADGHPFEADVKGQAISLRDRMILRDQHGKEIGVMLKIFGRVLETFKIYGFEPYMPGQKPSKQCCNGRRLYPWATVVNQAMSVRTRIGSMLVPQQLRLTRNGKVRASAKQKGFFQGITGSTRDLTIGPAIDPCLIVAFVAIVDEIREN